MAFLSIGNERERERERERDRQIGRSYFRFAIVALTASLPLTLFDELTGCCVLSDSIALPVMFPSLLSWFCLICGDARE